MYKRVGIDPTRRRPSSEALLRRVRKGEPLPRINAMVDVCNWCSLESQLPFGLYDASHISGDCRPEARRARRVIRRASGKTTYMSTGRITLADRPGRVWQSHIRLSADHGHHNHHARPGGGLCAAGSGRCVVSIVCSISRLNADARRSPARHAPADDLSGRSAGQQPAGMVRPYSTDC